MKLQSPDGFQKELSQKKEKMGPIYINIATERFYEAWDESSTNEI